MESGKGYWRRYVLPKIDLETGRAECRGSMPNVLASFGLGDQPQKLGVDAEAAPKIKGKPKQKTNLRRSNTVAAGAQVVTRLYPAGKRLLKPERNLSMAHAPRSGKEVFFWGWNSHGGCVRGDKCGRKQDSMGAKNLHWAVTAEMIRRGGHAKRSTRVMPENIDGAVGQLRERETSARMGSGL